MTFLASLDWVQIAWSAMYLAGLRVLQWYYNHGDPVHFDAGTSPP